MSLRTVSVPPAMEPLFARAEQVVSTYFAGRKDEPEKGTIEIFDQRYLLVRAASLSVEFFGVVRDLLGEGREAEADDFSRNILFDLAHAMGKSDARNFHEKMGLEEPVAKLSAGPVHFSHAGWAYVDISPTSRAVSGPDYYLLYDHPFSFESDAWLRAGKHSEFPVCIMNSGYSSGWCEESFGVKLVASEILCRAKGDDCCRFIMAPPERLAEHIDAYAADRGAEVSVGAHVIPDLFARKRLEDELREARDNLERRVEQRTAELKAINQKLEEEITTRARVERMLVQSQKLEAVGRLAGGIAHDFNNLLSAIGGSAQLLVRELEEGSEAAELAGEIAEAVRRASALTQQLLVFSRQQVAVPRVTELSRLIARLEDLLQRLLGEDIQLSIGRSSQSCCVKGDPTQLEQVVINLAVNARDAMPEGGKLEIRVARASGEEGEDQVCLIVEDTGSGMDEVALEHLFDPFFTTKKPGEGTGLGLAMVYGTVTGAGGRIEVDSEIGRGTRFEIRLPRAEAEPDAASDRMRSSTRSEAPRRLLVIEDDDAVRRLMVRALRDAGHELAVATTSEEALQIWAQRSNEIDAVVTDVIMPGMSGRALVEQLRNDREVLPVLYVSGYASDRVGQSAIDEPRTGFLQKPFEIPQLVRSLDAILTESE